MSSTSHDRVRPSHPWARLVAFAFDLLIGGCVTVMALMLGTQRGLGQIVRFGELTPEEQAHEIPQLMLGFVLAMVVAALLPLVSALLLTRSGQTPGKAMMGLTVRSVHDGQLMSLGRAITREYLRALIVLPALFPPMATFAPLLVGFITFDLLRSRLLQTFYDRLTGAIVVSPAPAD